MALSPGPVLRASDRDNPTLGDHARCRYRPNSAVRLRRTAPAARRSRSWRAIVPVRPELAMPMATFRAPAHFPPELRFATIWIVRASQGARSPSARSERRARMMCQLGDASALRM